MSVVDCTGSHLLIIKTSQCSRCGRPLTLHVTPLNQAARRGD